MIAARAAASGLATALLLAAAATSARAAASPCPDADGMRADPRGAGPLPSGSGAADFGQVPEACPAFDMLTRLRGVLLIARDGPDYYGNLNAGALLRLRYPVSAGTWISVAFDVATYRLVVNAGISSHSLDVGPPTVGVYRALPALGGGAVAVYARLLVPIDTARVSGIEFGGELGASYFLPGRRLAFQTGIAVPAPVVLTAGQAHAAVRPAALAEAVCRLGRATALTLGASARTQLAPDADPLAIAARAAARVALGRGMTISAAAELPFWGSDRTDLVASLFVGWTPPGPAVPGPR